VNIWLLIAARLLKNLHVPCWLIKISNQFDGRGHAQVRSLQFN
jgi:hypothetical protein